MIDPHGCMKIQQVFGDTVGPSFSSESIPWCVNFDATLRHD